MEINTKRELCTFKNENLYKVTCNSIFHLISLHFNTYVIKVQER